MDRSLQTAATGMVAQQTNIDIIANNLANINTTAFKKSQAHFTTLFSEVLKAPGSTLKNGRITPNGIQVGLGTQLDATNKSFKIGSLTNTSNSLDVAIEGDGFFQIQMPSGEIAFTRDGNFQINGETGELVTNRGHSLYPTITIGNDVESVTIAEDGTVSVIRPGNINQTEIVGNMRLVRFVNPAGLIEHADNLYLQTRASGFSIEGQPADQNFGGLRQGFLEQSNVKVVEEIVGMIASQRAYEANSNVIKSSDEMLRQANAMVS